ncbi:MAG: hypothetical protein HC851_16820, partial [Acaryochloris sp. RU_4_1]|nr:hypothetical protein [Acaryochloris sp. RU_4_1]
IKPLHLLFNGVGVRIHLKTNKGRILRLSRFIIFWILFKPRSLAKIRKAIATQREEDTSKADVWLGIAEDLRQQRKEKTPKKSVFSFLEKKPKKKDAQAWDSEMMLESAQELMALQELEKEESTGLSISGWGAGERSGIIVGDAAEEIPKTTGQEWYIGAKEMEGGVVMVEIPMKSIDLYIKALETMK